MKLRIGSRDSLLAVIQSRLVMDALQAAHPGIELELVTMKTTGDKILDRTLDQVGGKGLFVKELDAALQAGRVDLTVHSCKDLPLELPEGLPIAAFLRREDPRDVLALPEGAAEWDVRLPAGSASPGGGSSCGSCSRRRKSGPSGATYKPGCESWTRAGTAH